MIIVHGRATSTNVQNVMWCAAELGLDVDRRDVGGAFGGTDTPEYRAMNPNGVIPTVEIDGTVLWESAAIVRCPASEYASEACAGAGERWERGWGAGAGVCSALQDVGSSVSNCGACVAST